MQTALAIAVFGVGALLAVAIAAFGSATAQGRTAAAAMEAISRQPEAGGRIFISMLLALAFMEALTLFVFALVFIVQGVVSGLIAG